MNDREVSAFAVSFVFDYVWHKKEGRHEICVSPVGLYSVSYGV